MMVDLWNGFFGLVSAVLGGVITGLFMLWQQKREFRQRANDALRALLIEAEYNKALVIDLAKAISSMGATIQDYKDLRVPSLVPVHIRRAMWDTLLPLVAGPLERNSALETVDRRTVVSISSAGFRS